MLQLVHRQVRPAPQARPYQVAALDAVREVWSAGVGPDHPGPMLVMATGTGKTFTALYIAEQTLSPTGRMVWLAGRQELLDQPMRALWFDAHAAGIVQANRDASAARIVFASVATLINERRLHAVLAGGYPELLVIDEAHHAASPSYRQVIKALTGPNTRILGLTATADREDDGDLSEFFVVAYSFGLVEAIAGRYLLPPFAVVCRIPGFDPSKISGRRDYDDAELGAALLAAHIVEHTVNAMGSPTDAIVHLPAREGRQARDLGPVDYVAERLPRRDEERRLTARGRSTLVYTATVEQAQLTAEALTEAGWRARWVSGETPDGDRRRLQRAFEAGEIDVVCNAAVWTEGTDLPRCSCEVIARPTRSWSLFVQMTGRPLRPFPGQTEALIIDLAGATADHSLVSAPALIGGSRCEESPNGEHVFKAAKEGKAECEHCDARLPCWASLEAGGTGLHIWDEHGARQLEDKSWAVPRGVKGHGMRRCRACERPQCQESEDGRHLWIPQAGLKYQCLYCDAEIPMPLASLQARRDETAPPPPPAAWVGLRQLDRPVEVLDLGEHGLLFMVTPFEAPPLVPDHALVHELNAQIRGVDPYPPRDPSGFATPVWLPARARNPRPLTEGPVDRWYAEQVAADLVRKAKKAWDPARQESLLGGQGAISDVVDLRRRATARAVSTGVAAWR